jgi:dTDP-4-dehydrorhamnose reductase
VIRTSWVISGAHPNFVATMLRLAAEREIGVIADQRGRPTIAADLAAGTVRALDAGATGILHLANQGETSWFELARRSVELAGMPGDRIRPCATADYPTPAVRPAYSVLGSERLDELGLAPLPPWTESLPAVVAAQLARG